jgi:hypothetical protein
MACRCVYADEKHQQLNQSVVWRQLCGAYMTLSISY